jgi:hypothetical protein
MFVVGLIFAPLALAQEWKWTGFEIVGSRSVSREQIIESLPLKLGQPYKENVAEWEAWCSNLREKFGFLHADCSGLRYLDFRAYFVVSLVEKGEGYRIRYRPAPTQNIPIQDPEVFSLYDQLMKRLWELFGQGINAGEKTLPEYVDFEDPQMHALVLKLVERAPAVRDNLIQIVGFDKDPKKRADAAWILCWAKSPTDSIARVFSFLDDPAELPRNDISRFMTHWVSSVQDPKLEKPLLDALILQMKRPSHADRNKALSNLLSYLPKHPGAIPYFKSIGKDEIEHIAENSVLENVGLYAKEIQKLLTIR